MIKAFLDTNAFIVSLENAYSNSRLVVRAAIGSGFVSVVSQQVLEEVKGYVARNYSQNFANSYLYSINSIPLLKVVSAEKIKPSLSAYKNLVTDKDDLPHITACLLEDCDYFVTINRKLTQMKAKKRIVFVSPQKFVEALGMHSVNTAQEE